MATGVRACSETSGARSLRNERDTRRPTIQREKTSMMKATYTKPARVDLRPANPMAKRLRTAANPGRNRYNGRPRGVLLSLVVEYRPDRPLTNLREIPVLLFHDSIPSRNEVSGNPGAIQKQPKEAIRYCILLASSVAATPETKSGGLGIPSVLL